MRKPRRPRTLWAARALAVGLIAGALGNYATATAQETNGAEGTGFAAGEPGDPSTPSRNVAVAMTDDGGAMTFHTSLRLINRNEQIRFTVTNRGSIEHEFIIDSAENNAEHKAAMARTPHMMPSGKNGLRLGPGKSGALLWKFSKAGTFEYACLIPGHYEAGMHGTLTVK